MKRSDIYVPNPKVAFRNIAGRIVIVHPKESRMISLNETGSAIWDVLDGRSLEQIALKIERQFDVTFDEAMNDVEELVSELESRGLLSVKDR